MDAITIYITQKIDQLNISSTDKELLKNSQTMGMLWSETGEAWFKTGNKSLLAAGLITIGVLGNYCTDAETDSKIVKCARFIFSTLFIAGIGILLHSAFNMRSSGQKLSLMGQALQQKLIQAIFVISSAQQAKVS